MRGVVRNILSADCSRVVIPRCLGSTVLTLKTGYVCMKLNDKSKGLLNKLCLSYIFSVMMSF